MVFVATSSLLNAAAWFVAKEASPGGTGQSWRSALRDPVAALARARAGDEIWVKAGTYELGEALRLPSGVALLGGFTGDEASPADRRGINFAQETVLIQTRHGASVVELLAVRSAKLDGFTLTGATDAAGLLLRGCDESVEITFCRIRGNSAAAPGGGVRAVGGSRPRVFNCQIADNIAEGDGGGLFVDASSGGVWSWCIFSGNIARGATGGGALVEPTGRPRFDHCDFYFNESTGSGCALACGTGIELRDCTFNSNLSAADSGAGLPLRVRQSGSADKLVLSGATYVIGNLRHRTGPEFASGIEGEEFCELRGDAIVSKKESGPAELALFTQRNDVHVVMNDVFAPPITDGPPAPGRWVRQTLPDCAATSAYHCIYLPADWQPGRSYPVLVGFPGNGPFRNRFGDRSGGLPEDNPMGIGLTGGRGAIVLGLGYLDSRKNLAPTGNWWGDVAATIAYTEDAVRHVCSHYGGDPTRLVLYGFSRSAVGCSFIGLNDDTIAQLWRAFLCYDGWESQADMARDWYRYGQSSYNYDPKDFDGAGVALRFARLARRPLFILGGRGAVESLNESHHFPVELLAKPHRNHNVSWALRDSPERAQVREWLARVLAPDHNR